MARWIYSYMCVNMHIYMNIFAMMRLYVCCEHCDTMVSWSQFWSGLVKTCAASLIASPDHRRVILHVNTKSSWSKGSFDHTTGWRSVHMWSSREAVPYAWSSEYDQRDICSAHITMTKSTQKSSDATTKSCRCHAFVLDCASRAWLGCQAVSKIYVLNVSMELFSFNVHLTS